MISWATGSLQDMAIGQRAPDMNAQLQHYMQLGQELIQRRAQQMQMQSQMQAQPRMQGPTPTPSNYQSNLTSGFDLNWLDQRLAAGSANGARI
jgi:hypothetical protein